MANYFKKFVSFKIKSRNVNLYFSIPKNSSEFNEDLLNKEFEFFKSILLKQHPFFQDNKFKNNFDLATLPRDNEAEEEERLLAKDILQLKLNFKYVKNINEIKAPSIKYFEEKTIMLLAPLIGQILKSDNNVIPDGEGDFTVKVKIGKAMDLGEENLAIVYETLSDLETLYLGFHYQLIARYLVFPYYLSGEKTFFSAFPIKCIIHEIQHYKQMTFTNWERKVKNAIEEKFTTPSKLSPNSLLLFWALCELYKEAEAYFMDSKKNQRRKIDMNWIYNFRKNLFTMVSLPKNEKELWEFYNKYIDENTSLYVNALLMMATISFAEAKKDGHPEQIILYKDVNPEIKKLVNEIEVMINVLLNNNSENLNLLKNKIIELYKLLKPYLPYLIANKLRENINNLYNNNLTIIKKGCLIIKNEVLPFYDRFDLSKLNEIMTKEKIFYYGQVPEIYVNRSFNFVKNYVTSTGKLSPATHFGFIKKYEDACNILRIDRNNRVIDLFFYKELKKLTLEKDKKMSEQKEAYLLG
ncbi:MAG: hypothetical protein QXE31_04170 [Candidatus Woesearchaeota archaeon]